MTSKFIERFKLSQKPPKTSCHHNRCSYHSIITHSVFQFKLYQIFFARRLLTFPRRI